MIWDSLKNINYFKLQPLPSLKELLFLSMVEISECILLCIAGYFYFILSLTQELHLWKILFTKQVVINSLYLLLFLHFNIDPNFNQYSVIANEMK